MKDKESTKGKTDKMKQRKVKGVSGDRKVYQGPNGGLYVVSLCNGEMKKRYIKDNKCTV